VQEAAFGAALKVPAAQSVQTRLVVDVPPDADWPAKQLVHATHAVAGLESSSHVPEAHAVFGVVPPGQ
jgi:hypothetical protein